MSGSTLRVVSLVAYHRRHDKECIDTATAGDRRDFPPPAAVGCAFLRSIATVVVVVAFTAATVAFCAFFYVDLRTAGDGRR